MTRKGPRYGLHPLVYFKSSKILGKESGFRVIALYNVASTYSKDFLNFDLESEDLQ